MKRKILRLFLFSMVLGLGLVRLNNIFKFKYGDGIYGMEIFYELPKDTVDVLILGSSHAFEDINPAVLYEEQGIAAYDLCGSVQPMWNTYYYLQEALKSQKPALVILEAYCVNMDVEYIDDSRIIKNTYGMKWSGDKLAAMKVSAPKERQIEFLLGPMQYHGRYTELSEADFLPYQANTERYKNWKGFGNNMSVAPQEKQDISEVTQEIKLSKKTKEYYKKIIKLTKQKEIPLFIVISPYSGINQQEQGKYLKAAKIAEKYGTPFLNCNLLYDEIGLDFDTDFADGAHLNYLGNRKYTSYLGNYLKQNYSLPDRRSDPKYGSWDLNLKYYKETMVGKELQQYSNITDYLTHVPTEDCITMLTATDVSMWQQVSSDIYSELSDNILVKNGDSVIYNSSEEGVWHSDINGIDFAISNIGECDSTGKMLYHQVLNIGLSEYQKVSNGINIVIYNTYTKEVVDAVGFDATKDYALVR